MKFDVKKSGTVVCIGGFTYTCVLLIIRYDF